MEVSMKKRRSISDAIDEYFEDMERWAEHFSPIMEERPCWNLKNCAIEPLRHVTVTPSEVIVTVDLPYANKKTAKVEVVDENALEISAEMRKRIRLNELGVTHMEGVIQRFHSWIRIPVRVDVKKMKTQHKKGILEIRLPRKR